MKNQIHTFFTVILSLFFTTLYSQTLTWDECTLSSGGTQYYYNNSKTFTNVPLSSTDVQILIGLVGCNPVATNAGGIKLNGTTFVQSNVPVQNCGFQVTPNNVYTISQSVFNQAVTSGGGTIVFKCFINDTCVPGVGCNFLSDPCIKMTASYTVLSNESFDNTNFLTYPNPVKDILNLKYNDEISSIVIFNTLGQELINKVINSSESSIDISQLPPATYLVKVFTTKAIKTVKVTKQ